MAIRVTMQHKDSGLTKQAFVGFSWTSFFFGGFPALFRADFINFLAYVFFGTVLTIATLPVLGAGGFIFQIWWCFAYNKLHGRALMNRGYVVVAAAGLTVEQARARFV